MIGVRIGNGFVDLCQTEFICPACGQVHEEKDWYSRYDKSKEVNIYRRCKKCRKTLGITVNIMGDVVVWLKTDEKFDHKVK